MYGCVDSVKSTCTYINEKYALYFMNLYLQHELIYGGDKYLILYYMCKAAKGAN